TGTSDLVPEEPPSRVLTRETGRRPLAEPAEVIGTSVAVVIDGRVPLDVAVRVAARRPAPAVGGDLRIGVEVVERDEPARELVLVRRDVLTADSKRRSAVA